MSPAARVRALVGAAAVAAAGVVTGVVLATRQDPAQPKAQCAGGAQALVVPGVETKRAAAVRAAMRLGQSSRARQATHSWLARTWRSAPGSRPSLDVTTMRGVCSA